MEPDELTERVIGCAIEIHRVSGPGLLEPTQQQCWTRELSLNGTTKYLKPVKDIQCFQVSALKGQDIPAQGKPAKGGCRPGVQGTIDPTLKGSKKSLKWYFH